MKCLSLNSIKTHCIRPTSCFTVIVLSVVADKIIQLENVNFLKTVKKKRRKITRIPQMKKSDTIFLLL